MRRGASGSAHLLEERGIDALFVPPSSDLEYLTGIERDLPSFGNISYAHGWVAGAFLAPGREPLFVLPRMVVDFHLDGSRRPAPSSCTRTPTAGASSPRRSRSLGAPSRLALGAARLGGDGDRAASARCPDVELLEGSSLVNELRRVKSPAELRADGAGVPIARERWTR